MAMIACISEQAPKHVLVNGGEDSGGLFERILKTAYKNVQAQKARRRCEQAPLREPRTRRKRVPKGQKKSKGTGRFCVISPT